MWILIPDTDSIDCKLLLFCLTMQEEKQLNPASRRVRDAAEHLLSVVMEQVENINKYELPSDRRCKSWTKEL
jgi:hypothetical protein